MFEKKINDLKDYIRDAYSKHTMDIDCNYKRIREVQENIITLMEAIKEFEPTENDIKYLNVKIDNQTEIIRSQQKTINTLVEALCNKFDNGLFVYSDDGKIPFVIRNGKVLTDKMTASFRVSWDRDCLPEIEIQQDGTTNECMPTNEEIKHFSR